MNATDESMKTLAPILDAITRPDPRDADYSRPGIFATHNCWKCDNGKKPCANGNPNRCDYLHARND